MRRRRSIKRLLRSLTADKLQSGNRRLRIRSSCIVSLYVCSRILLESPPEVEPEAYLYNYIITVPRDIYLTVVHRSGVGNK